MKTVPRTKNPTKESDAETAAQAEFLDDIRASLEEMQAGKVLPADEALELIALGLDDDELERRLH